jgi:hypothetical protein
LPGSIKVNGRSETIQKTETTILAIDKPDLYADLNMRKNAIKEYKAAESLSSLEKVAARFRVSRQDLNDWKLYRFKNFSKNGRSEMVKRIEEGLLRRP